MTESRPSQTILQLGQLSWCQQYLVADWTATVGPAGCNLAELRRGFVFHYAGAAPSLGTGSTIGGRWFFLCVPSIVAGYSTIMATGQGRPSCSQPSRARSSQHGGIQMAWPTNFPLQSATWAQNRKGRLATLHDKASGFGIARFNTKTGSITMNAMITDAANPADRQFVVG